MESESEEFKSGDKARERGRPKRGKRHNHRMYCSINAKAAKLTPSL